MIHISRFNLVSTRSTTVQHFYRLCGRYNRWSGTTGRRTGSTRISAPRSPVLSSMFVQSIFSSACVCNPLIFAGFLVFSSCVCTRGSSSRSAPRKTKKRARRTLRPVVSDDEEEVVIPTKPTRREKSAAAKQRVVLPLHHWKAKDWEAFRSKNPYVVPIAPRWTTV